MLKKLGITALVVVAALFTLHKLDLLGYGKYAMRKVKEEARNSIPPEVKIERLKQEIAQIDPSMREHKRAMAGEQVEIEKLQRQIASAKKSLNEQWEAISSVRSKLDDGKVFVDTVSGREVPADKVKADLATQFNTYKQAEAAVQAQEELLEQRLENLKLSKQKIGQMEAKKEELKVKVAQLEAELKKVRMAQTKNNSCVDNSQLDRVLKLYEEIDDQIAREKVELEMQKADLIEANTVKTEAERLKVEKSIKELDERLGKVKVASDKK